MRYSRLIPALSAFPLLVAAPGPAHSQSIRGQLSYQSRVSIRIEASVMPRFQLSGSSVEPGVSSNAPALRYSLVTQSPVPALNWVSNQRAAAGTSGNNEASQPLLMLVVPD